MKRHSPRVPAFVWLAAIILLACGTACDSSRGPLAAGASATSGGSAPLATPAGRDAGTAPPAPVVLQYGLPVATVAALDMFVAERRGLFSEQRLQVELVLTGPASQATQALVSGSVDIGSAASDSAISTVEKGADLVLLAGAINRVVFTLIGSRDVRGYADLRGKNIAVSDLRDGSTTLLRRLLQHAGLRMDDVNLVPLGGTPNRAAAVTNGQAAAAVLSQPANFRLIAEGYPRLGLTTDAVPNYFFQGHNARRAWLRDNGDTAVQFLRAIVAADRYLNDPANRADVIAILADGTKTDLAESSQTYDLMISQVQGYSLEGEINVEGLRTVITILGETGVLEPPLPPVEKYYDLSYLARAWGN